MELHYSPLCASVELIPLFIDGYLGRLATSTSVTRPNQVHLRYGSQVCLTGFRRTDHSVPLRFGYMYERAIYMVNSFQFTRSARLSLVFRRRNRNGVDVPV